MFQNWIVIGDLSVFQSNQSIKMTRSVKLKTSNLFHSISILFLFSNQTDVQNNLNSKLSVVQELKCLRQFCSLVFVLSSL